MNQAADTLMSEHGHNRLKPTIEEIKNLLGEGLTTLTFEKADGTIRELVCTRDPLLVPDTESLNEPQPRGKERPANIICVYDVENVGWCSFKYENLRSLISWWQR